MRIHFDITHGAHANFFKNLVPMLSSSGHDVRVTVLQRGRLPDIVRELYKVPVTVIGQYCTGLLTMAVRTGLVRSISLARYFSHFPPDILVGVACFQPALLARFMSTVSIGLYDDPEHPMGFKLTRLFCNRFLAPECVSQSAKGIISFKGLKEWAYLSPEYFKPDSSILNRYGVKPGEYIFIRSIDPSSLNYRGQADPILELYRTGLETSKVLLSLERKDMRPLFTRWSILEEPVGDIHSLMYFSKAVISSGDSMAREGSQLGVRSFYCGNREMMANRELIEKGFMTHETNIDQLCELVSGIEPRSQEEQRARRRSLASIWDDPNKLLFNLIQSVGKVGSQ